MTLEEAQALREAMAEGLPRDASQHGHEAPEARFLYVPESHVRALSPDNMVVRGIRGAGKTFWWQSLRDDGLRAEIVRRLPRARLSEVAQVVPGFGGPVDPDHYPDRDTIVAALQQHPAAAIWRAVVLRALAPSTSPAPWAQSIAWVAANPEAVARMVQQADRRAGDAGAQPVLLVFDGVDRAAHRWEDLVALHRGLLEVLLDLRQSRSLRGKAFLRADLLDEPGVTGFADASKVVGPGNVVDLRWTPLDLYGLLWQYLGNVRGADGALHRGAQHFRHLVPGTASVGPDDTWWVPEAARRSEPLQERLMATLAGQWMGTDHRRGKVYTWLPNHLLDGRRQVSPRSFLVALQAAASETPREHPLALDWRAVARGVAAASEVRVTELTREEHPWVGLAAAALRGLRIPAEADELIVRWQVADTVAEIDRAQTEAGPPPRHLPDGETGLLQDLIALGVLNRLPDGRIQVPDVYRVHFGMLRKGGVPVAR